MFFHHGIKGFKNRVFTPTDAPVNLIAPVAMGNPAPFSTISCSTGTWIGEAPIVFTYQWYADDVLIPGADSSSYLIDIAYEGASFYCDVTGTNTAGQSIASSNVIGTFRYFVDNTLYDFIDGTPYEYVYIDNVFDFVDGEVKQYIDDDVITYV